MSLSIQTNVNSLTAQENLRVNSNFQSQTIQRLTSGYRINSSSDDAAGLAVANTFRNNIAELTQGVRNANDGLAQLQIADGGLTNISNILDRLKTLATESASNTFTGDRSTLNNEYQSLLSEVTRQASNIGMVQNGTMNKQLQIYIGGGNTQSNAQVGVDLSGTANQVDAAGLGIGTTNITAGGITLAGNTVSNLNNPGLMVLQNTVNGDLTTETFNISYIANGGAASKAVSITNNTAAGITVSAALSQLNSQLSTIGLSAAVNSNGQLVIGGGSPFAVKDVSTTYGGGAAVGGTNDLSSTLAVTQKNANVGTYNFGTDVTSLLGASTNLTLGFSNGTVTKYATFSAADVDAASFVTDINSQVGSMGIYALATNSTMGISIQSSSNFTITCVGQSDATGGATSGFAASAAGAQTNATAPLTTASATGNAMASLNAIQSAILALGKVQGKIGAGENALGYAINLANSQITNFSSAQSQIRDADVASEAANLTKAQVLQQASIAAMAQANSAPQAVLSLLKG